MTVTRAEQPGPPSAVDVRRALDCVMDPELDEPITDLGFVRSLDVGADGAVEVHLRLPTAFCSPNFAYLMASDAKDAIGALPGARRVVVELDDHHDSEVINAGLAADAGYKGTFGAEAEQDLEELRATFRRKAHVAAVERVLTPLLRAGSGMLEADLGAVTLRDLPESPAKDALRRRRGALGLPDAPEALVLVDENGHGYAASEVPLRLRLARSTRISIEGNGHFCRGLLRTRYPGSGADQAPRPDDGASGDPIFVPLTQLSRDR